MAQRITITVDKVLDKAIKEAPARLGVSRSSSKAERIRAWARQGYIRALEDELDRKRIETWDDWAGSPEMAESAEIAKASLLRNAALGLYDE